MIKGGEDVVEEEGNRADGKKMEIVEWGRKRDGERIG